MTSGNKINYLDVFKGAASEVKTQDATNPNSYFVFGRELLDKDIFNKVNENNNDRYHGVGVIYGPFDSLESVKEFVDQYPSDLWPGHSEWCCQKAGKPFIITHAFENVEIVRNKSLPFQMNLQTNMIEKRAKEIKQGEERFDQRDPSTMTEEELATFIRVHEDRLNKTKEKLEKYTKQKEYLIGLKGK